MIEKVYENPNIYRVKVSLPDNPLKYLNCYVVESQGEYLIIDTGFNRPECRAAMEAGLAELNIEWSRAKLFLTHLHSDHTGLVDYFVKRNVPIFMGESDHDYLMRYIYQHTWAQVEVLFSAYGFPSEEMVKQSGGNHARGFAPKEGFDSYFVADNDILQVGQLQLRCIKVPGHTPGQFCLYLEQEKLLFSADHVLFDITPNISVWLGTAASLKDYLESLDKLTKLDIKMTLPGHREFQGDIYQRIATLKHHHRIRLAEIAEAIAQQPGCTAYEVAGRISWSSRGRTWEEFPPNQRWFAMGETLSHIVWLGQQGYLRKDVTNHLWLEPKYTGPASIDIEHTQPADFWL